MDEVLSEVRGGWVDQQHQVIDSIVCAIKWIFPLLPGKAKDLVSNKKLLAGEVDWECMKEVLCWIVDTEAGRVSLPERNIKELYDLLDIPTYQRRMDRKDMDC